MRQKELSHLQELAKQQEKQAAKPKQKRQKWEDAETKILCEMVVGNSSGSPIWREISNEINRQLQYERGNVHCKDRMRTLCEQLGEADNQAAAQKWLNLQTEAAADAQLDDNAQNAQDSQDDEKEKLSQKRARK